MLRLACAFAVLLLVTGCTTDNETRAREAADKIKQSIPDIEAAALAQKTTPEEIKAAQQALTSAKEYQGEVTGVLDSVTINAIEAFQRSHGITDDGILNDKTRAALKAG